MSAEVAFRSAVYDARVEYGNRGYTGSIVEKDGFVVIPFDRDRKGCSGKEYANQLIDECDERIDDKWGPAGCLSLGDDRYLFFGWASC